MGKFKDGRERNTVGRPSQARRYQTRLRSNALGQERERESVIMNGVTAVDHIVCLSCFIIIAALEEDRSLQSTC
jgi:hypothetical protein